MAYGILGLVIETVTGLPYADTLESLIAAPLGLSQTSVWAPDMKLGAIAEGDSWWNVSLGIDNP